ncbi:MAG: peptidoglycan-binding protein [Rhodospirillales bacterium]|nr:peptidoglycan-binding protein [Rhodospirillales bacterium]
MYTHFFGLNRLPFEASPDPSFLFDGPVHREAIASIEYAVATRMGFIMLTGEVGLGKTTVIRAFLDRFDRQRLLPIYVFHPLLSFDDLLELLSDELGLTLASGIGSFNRLRAIQRELIRLYEEKRQVILVIDEAQRLPEDTLENLRLLTNLETTDAKLLQIVLVGQPELEEILAQGHLRQLEQRIVLKARLDNLTPEESLRYMRHRLTLAGADDPEKIMSAATLRAIVDLAEGVPRRMNILANRALIDAFGANEKPVTAARVRRVAASNVKERPAARPKRSWGMAMGIVLAFVACAGLALFWETNPARFKQIQAMAWPDARSDATPPAAPARPVTEAPLAAPQAPAPKAEPQPPPARTPQHVTAEESPTGKSTAPSTPSPAAAIRVVAPSPPPAVVQATPVPPPPTVVPAAASPDLATLSASLKGGVPHDTPYTVVPGDTLWKICLQAYGPEIAPSMISKVMSRNRIISDIRLLWGTTIILPSPTNS